MINEVVDAVVKRDVDYMLDKAQKSIEKLRGGRILITGAAGFLGYYLLHIVRGANERGADIKVSALDNFSRGEPRWMAGFRELPGFEIITQDIIQPLEENREPYDWIIHGASIASPMYYRQFPIETMDANIIGLRHLLDYGVRYKVKGLLFFSTSEIYGNPPDEHIPTKESYNGNVSCTGPRACYDESKRFGETLCVNFAQARGLAVSMVRPFNNYGPGLDIQDKRVVPDFCNDILNGRDITLLSDGSPMRTFCYIADAIPGYLSVMTHGGSGQVFNIGNDEGEISMRGLAEELIVIAKQELEYQGSLVFKNSDDEHYLTDNPSRRCPNIDKARQALAFSPGISLQDGLARTLQWYAGMSQV